MKQAKYTHRYFLTAGECDATGHMPLTLLIERLIEVATEHANELGIGYADLKECGIGWVLSRLSVEMDAYPGINDSYSVTTWIESLNKRFSSRNMLIADAAGVPIGYARTLWAPINLATRGLADLTPFVADMPVCDNACPIAPYPRMPHTGTDAAISHYTFKYCDLDFNRHVNTVRYVSLLLNQWPLEHYDANMVGRFDIGFARECHFSETVALHLEEKDGASLCELLRNEERVLAARFLWRKNDMS